MSEAHLKMRKRELLLTDRQAVVSILNVLTG